uniref:Uncharacterized protein n=1 Tax=Cyprinus carpio carpio TaxID=630221 RepID=A0A9J8CH41_CYPCA
MQFKYVNHKYFCVYKMKMFVLITTISKLSLHPTVPSHLHLLCVDMTGHEGTTRTNTDDYSIQGQVKRIRHQGCIKLNAIQEIDEFHYITYSPMDGSEGKYIFIFGQMHEVEHSHYSRFKTLLHTSHIIPHSDFYHQVFMGIMSENSKYALHEHIQQITTPLQVIRGKQDQVGISLMLLDIQLFLFFPLFSFFLIFDIQFIELPHTIMHPVFISL